MGDVEEMLGALEDEEEPSEEETEEEAEEQQGEEAFDLDLDAAWGSTKRQAD